MIAYPQSVRRAKSGQSDSFIGSPLLQTKFGRCPRKRQLLQRSALKNSSLENRADSAQPIHDVLRSPGVPIDPATRAFMEPRFGQDFSRVRVHTGAKASESAKAVDALAYAVGQHLVFKEAHYNPGVESGRALLAHELAHVGPQESALVSGSLRIADSKSASERQAADASAQVLNSGQAKVQAQQRTTAQIARQPDKSNHVNIIRVSCESNTIEFDTDTGVYV